MSLQTVGGTKYGLVVSSKAKASAPTLKRPALAAFADDDDGDDDDDDEGSVEDAELSKRANIERANKLLMSRQTTMLEGPTETSVFDFDGAYDSFKAPSSGPQQQQQQLQAVGAKAKYVESMMATAKLREKEKERAFERKLLKERQKEDELYPEQSEKFVTAAYKEKLKEKERWEYEDRRQAEQEKQHDVRTKGMEGFYGNLLTRNVAVGGRVEDSALSVYTAGSDRSQKVAAALAPASAPAQQSAPSTQAQPSSGAHARPTLRQEQQEQRESSAPSPSSSSSSSSAAAAAAAEEGKERGVGVEPKGPSAQSGREEKIAAARARFLARKAAAQAQA